MTHLSLVVLLVAATFVGGTNGGNIVAFLPTPSYSHQSVFKVYLEEMARRQHVVYIIKPNISTVKFEQPTAGKGKIIEIDSTLKESSFVKLLKESRVYRKRGLVADVSTVTADNYINLVQMVANQLQLPHVRSFIEKNIVDETGRSLRFDVLITEAYIDYPLILSHLLHNLPVIQISSGHGVAENFETMGAISRHPLYFPNMWRTKFVNVKSSASSSSWNFITQLYAELKLKYEFTNLADRQSVMFRDTYGDDTPDVYTLRNNVQLLLINVHPWLDNNRPVPPSVQYLGGLHLVNVDEYSAQIINSAVKKFLDSSDKPVVYISFGSGIEVANNMDMEFFNMLVSTFDSLKTQYNFLWKYESDQHLDKIPTNVLVQKWFEQQAVLKHKNITAFVTQSGIQSIDEAIDSLVPMIGLPLMGDQAFNANKIRELKLGCVVDTVSVDTAGLVRAIKDVAENPVYRHNLRRLRHSIRNPMISPLQKATWFTEHVITRKFNSNLKPQSANTSYSQYYMCHMITSILFVVILNQLRYIIQLYEAFN
ncbi:Ecdysteroid UDP-glucosyltransferase [Perigonia lusca single nucleopolyhedrovirus]|uniref:Ecdysteroid UDP-glucosyltransferase n=1 Tax=Perigonia lusca single nucleopolyhedrovirus TaxID=1675865 RepID=A0A0M3WN91_9ABAC|nr:Ecdysteroid UDP-glucosyltransferase [Perigonia lusca single nucleopolyhedrovirus]AKN80687.1 Ecdysteroid UDP-glucosyltransferase [Perigonia lusca single nucleopolyhedrovirus]